MNVRERNVAVSKALEWSCVLSALFLHLHKKKKSDTDQANNYCLNELSTGKALLQQVSNYHMRTAVPHFPSELWT